MWSPTWRFTDDMFEKTAESFDNPDFVDCVIHSYRHRYILAPGDPAVGSLHRRLIPMLGFVVGELLDLGPLASLCAADSRWDFMFVAAPLNLPGGVGSPANAVAIR